MYDNGTYRPRFTTGQPSTWERLQEWALGRSRESWAFFAAGFVLAAILT